MAVFLLIVAIISTWTCYSIAKTRGANIRFWIVMAVCFGPFAIPFAFFAKPTSAMSQDNGNSD